MLAPALLQQIIQLRAYAIQDDLEGMAASYSEYERTFLAYCRSRGWRPRPDPIWIQKAAPKSGEALFTEALIGIANLVLTADYTLGQQANYEQAAGRYLTYLREAHARVFSQLAKAESNPVLVRHLTAKLASN